MRLDKESVRRGSFWILAAGMTVANGYAQGPATAPGAKPGPLAYYSGQSRPGTVPAYQQEATATVRRVPPGGPPASAGPVASASSFTITSTLDPTFTTAEANAINSAVTLYENTFTTPINVTIQFIKVTSGFANSTTTIYGLDYMTFISALQASATSADDMLAFGNGRLPITTNNPVSNTSNIYVKTATIKALGISGSFPPTASGGFDGQININTSLMDVDGGSFSMFAAVEHEMDEVLGLGSALPGLTDPFPEDLFRYASTANVRSFSTNGCTSPPQAFFSIDGTNAVDEFNNCNNGGDYGDWITHTPSQIQDAVTNGSGAPSLMATSPEARALDVIGYTIASPLPNAPGSFLATPH